MVSKSGTICSRDAGSVARRHEPRLLEQHRDLEQVRHALGLRDHVLADRLGPERGDAPSPPPRGSRARPRAAPSRRRTASAAAAAWRARRAAAPAAPARPARGSRASRAPRAAAPRSPARARPSSGAGPRWRGGSRRCAPRGAACAAARRRAARAARAQARVDHVEVGRERRGIRVGLGLAHGGAVLALAGPSALGRGRQPRVDAGERAAIGLVLAEGRAVGRALGQRRQRGREARQRPESGSSAPSACTCAK